MSADDVIRPVETRAVSEFLSAVSVEAAALVLEGEPGIGKTTLWLGAIHAAEAQGFAVLSARGAETESVMAYAALADLLQDADIAAYSRLPAPQLTALDHVLLRTETEASATEPRTVAAGFLSVIDALAEASPVIIAMDDTQWLDPSSIEVLSFAVRRLSGRVGVLATVRNQSGGLPWLQLPRPERCNRIGVRPLTVSGLHSVMYEQLGRTLTRPSMERIHAVSGGNPFFALELVRSQGDSLGDARMPLPGSLAELVRHKLGDLSEETRDALLVASCLAVPTVGVVAHAVDTEADRLVEILEEAEDAGIVEISGHRLDFTHPLLARGVYSDATPPQRRTAHHRLAEVVEHPELRARHLAMAAMGGEPSTIESLDRAAESARVRGAPAAAAELRQLAVDLGGTAPQRRIQLARDHFDAGNPQRSRTILEELVRELPKGPARADVLRRLGFVHFFDDSFIEAATILRQALDESGDDLALRTRLLIKLSYAQYNAGQFGAATATVEAAVVSAEDLNQRRPLSQALRMQVLLRFLRGDGLDEDSLTRAMQLDDQRTTGPISFRPNVQHAMLMSWIGRLDQAHEQLESIRRQCLDTGEENELISVASHSFLVEVWRGNFADAALIAEDTVERALQLGGDVPLAVAMTLRATLAAYAGRERQTRSDVADALAASRRSGASLFAIWPLSTLGFLEVSLGNYDAALTVMEPLLSGFAPRTTEIIVGWFIPHAVEALVALDRPGEAEPLVAALEDNGRRLDRPWMRAVGGRCRAMLLAAEGDADAALSAAEQAMVQHGRIPMPYEAARTRLLLGVLARATHKTELASTTVTDAFKAFDELGIPLWAERARAELAQGSVGSRRATGLTPAERRVAELAATGMSNRAVAGALFVSPKTVEAALARAYRKLGVRSRAELGQRMGREHPP